MSNLSPLEDGLQDVVQEAFERGFTVKCDFARRNAEYVAMAASLGFLTTRVTTGVYSSEWRPTPKGLLFLNEKGEDTDG